MYEKTSDEKVKEGKMHRFLFSFFSRILPLVVFIHALIFIVFWLTNSLFYASTNDYLADLIGQRLDYVSLLIWVSSLIGVWSGIRFVLSLLRRSHKLVVFSAWLYGIISLLYIAFFYGSFWLLFSESPVQFVRIYQLLTYFRLILDSVLILVFALLVALSLRNFLQKKNLTGGRRNWMPLIIIVLVFGILWSLPLIFTPGSVAHDQLPDKPLIIAHRGASMLAPENTLAAANLAAELGVYGLETDIQISRDGELFLLHDDTFDRTTDIKSVFPGREGEPAGNFTLAEIKQLNAGVWFVEQDPFHALSRGIVTTEQVQQYRQQTVPLLADWLDIVRTNHLAFIFDLKGPPEDHLYAGSLFEIALNQVHQTGIDPQVWFLVDTTQLKTVRELAPEILPAFGTDYQ
jgi:glycerophosphoryl diester phosphodiesterase